MLVRIPNGFRHYSPLRPFYRSNFASKSNFANDFYEILIRTASRNYSTQTVIHHTWRTFRKCIISRNIQRYPIEISNKWSEYFAKSGLLSAAYNTMMLSNEKNGDENEERYGRYAIRNARFDPAMYHVSKTLKQPFTNVTPYKFQFPKVKTV